MRTIVSAMAHRVMEKNKGLGADKHQIKTIRRYRKDYHVMQSCLGTSHK